MLEAQRASAHGHHLILPTSDTMPTSDDAATRSGADRGKAPSSAAARAIKLRSHQARLMAELLPRLALDLAVPPPSDLAGLFDVPVREVRLEIGFGGGEHLVAEALAFPQTGFIGVEPYVNGMAKVLAQIEAHRVEQHPPAGGRCGRTAGMGAGGVAAARRPDPSGPLAEAAALETALRPARHHRGAGTRRGAGRRISLRQRYRSLLCLDAGAFSRLAGDSAGPRSAPTTGASRGPATP